jgi:phosphohistidine phosphatase SixA
MSLSDHDRPLLPVGVKKTNRIVKYLKAKSVKPDLLL